MTCSTCHSVHQNERGRQQLFAERCLSCHADRDCGVVRREGSRMRDRCIDCHMPKRADTETAIHTPQGTLLPMLRDHHIRIAPDVSREVLTR